MERVVLLCKQDCIDNMEMLLKSILYCRHMIMVNQQENVVKFLMDIF